MSASFLIKSKGRKSIVVHDSAEAAEAVEKLGDRKVTVEFSEADDSADEELATMLIKQKCLGLGDLETWYDDVEDLSEIEKAAVYYQIELSSEVDLAAAVHRATRGGVSVYQGDMEDVARHYVEEEIADTSSYFDYESYGSDSRSDMLSHAENDMSDNESELDDAKERVEDAKQAIKDAEDDNERSAAESELEDAEDEVARMEAGEGDTDYARAVAYYNELDNMSARQLGEYCVANLYGSVEEVPNSKDYVDYEAYARDLSHDHTEFEFDGRTYVAADY